MLAESSSLPGVDSRFHWTFDRVNWGALSSVACELFQVKAAHWGDQISGGFNIVRFLHLHNSKHTIIVARVPLRSEDAASPENDWAISKRIVSEVATMEYVERYTSIPIPHVHLHSVDFEGGVRSPYILMSKAEGVPLSSVWKDMDDTKRDLVLRQVVVILLDLWSHRFDKPGALFKRPDVGHGKAEDWYVDSNTFFEDNDNRGSCRLLPMSSYTHAADYWLAYANANLQDVREADFGSTWKPYSYCETWFMRSLIPALFDPSLDTRGYPLCPGDFHSQNIMITNVGSHPRITGVIDWEFSGPKFATSFAHYPLFIVDHPHWDEDHPLRSRNIRDQKTFDCFMLDAEQRRPSVGAPLSSLIRNSRGIYLFKLIMMFPDMYTSLYELLFKYVYGDDEKFPGSFYLALLERGILKKDNESFIKETQVWLEAQRVLGEGNVSSNLTTREFRDLVSRDVDRFDSGGLVREWLASI